MSFFHSSAGPKHDTPSPYYGYIPSLPATAIMMVIFIIATILHLVLAIRYKVRYMLFTAVGCGIFEIAGWGARLYSHFHPTRLRPFLFQAQATLNGPSLLVAAYFVILSEIIRRVGPCYSRLQPKTYAGLFVTADLVSLILQGVGGVLASIAVTNGKNASTGGRIMMGGLVLQLLLLTICAAMSIEFVFRYRKDRPFEGRDDVPTSTGSMNPTVKKVFIGIAFSALLIYARSMYRTIGVIDGWGGPILKNELAFNIMDGTMIVIAMFCLSDCHPGKLARLDTAGKDIESYDSNSDFRVKPNA